jgi:hypothetical protein
MHVLSMKKITFFILVTVFPSLAGFCQKVSGKLLFQQGQMIAVTTEVKSTVSQEAMGQAIDFTADGAAIHSYKVTNATDDNNTLHHEVKSIAFNFDGMGQKRSFDSENKKDMDGQFGPVVKDILSKSFDLVIDTAGKVLLVKPEKLNLSKSDDKLAIVMNMLKDVTGVVYPPKKNEASFFKVLPHKEITLNDSWTEAIEDSTGKFNTVYTLSGITDSTLVVDLKGSSVTTTKAEMMGQPIVTTMNNTFTGQIILDRVTGIIREKNIATESNGTTEAMGGTLPVTSKTNVTIHVTPER